MSVKIVLVAACALVDADGRVLLAQRPAGKTMAGLWEFPGGKIETGERPEQSLIRELKEELGITVSDACLAPLTFASHAYPDFHLLMPLYVCRRWEGTVTALEGQKLAWVTAEQVAGLRDAAGGRSAGIASDGAAVIPDCDRSNAMDGRMRINLTGRAVAAASCAMKAVPRRSNMP